MGFKIVLRVMNNNKDSKKGPLGNFKTDHFSSMELRRRYKMADARVKFL